MRGITRFGVLVVSIFALLAVFTGPAMAEYPDKTITVFCVFAPGGTVDTSIRALAFDAEKTLDQNMVIVTKDGGGGTVGLALLAGEKPDGYTLVATHESVISSYITGVADFNYSNFIPVANMVATPNIMAARADAPWNNVKELIEDAEKNPGKIKFGATLGSTSHFFPLEFAQAAGIEFKIVGYEGTADRQAALLGGFIDLGESNVAAGNKYFAAKKLKGLGIAMENRHPLMPKMPTLKEQGIDITFAVNRGICAPLNTPQPVIDALAAALKKASEDPEYVKTITDLGSDVVYKDPTGYKAYIDRAVTTWSRLAKEIGLEKKK